MFILLDKDREMVGELTDFLSITVSIRFSMPGQLSIVLSEESDWAKSLKELMHVYHVETGTLFLVDYIERNTVYNDMKAVNVKCITIEGFLEQRIIYQDKILDGVSLQTAIREMFTENVTAPVDETRKLDFFSFENSTDNRVRNVVVKGLVSGISVMQAITSLLESKNMGYKVTYNIVTKTATFMIVAGRNLCEGFTSTLNGPSLLNTVTLSSQSETLKDVRSVTDMAPYKTRVYVKNFDDVVTFNRGATESGIDLREGYLSTGHGEGGDWDGTYDPGEIPPPPELVMPEITMPPEIPVEPPKPSTSLIGLYVLTSRYRLLGCAFYPGMPIPEVWYDITPDYENGTEDNPNDVLTSRMAKVTLVNGDLIIKSGDFKRVYRASMAGGWLGTRYFKKAERILDITDPDFAPDLDDYQRSVSFISAFDVDVYTGRIAGVVASRGLTTPWFDWHHTLLFDGTAYDLLRVPGIYGANIAYPSFFNWWPWLSVNNGVITYSGHRGTMGSGITSFNTTTKQWVNDNTWGIGGFDAEWHIRPEPNSYVTYCAGLDRGTGPVLCRSKNGFADAPIEAVLGNFGYPTSMRFSMDGRTMINIVESSRFRIGTLPTDKLSDWTSVLTPFSTVGAQYPDCLSSAGTDKVSKRNAWGYLNAGRSLSTELSDHGTPAYYYTTKSDFTDVQNITPLLKTYLEFGPWGLTTSNTLNEWPIYAWPILG